VNDERVTVLRDVLIEAGELDRYYETVPTNLWRARRVRDRGSLLGLVEEEFILSNGRPRPADITIEIRGGAKWVTCRPFPRGISTFDRPNVFSGTSWEYYKIPAGTVLPRGLAIVRDSYRERVRATHHTIAPAWDMPLATFKALLDELAQLIAAGAA
jgi:hypothetical protein